MAINWVFFLNNFLSGQLNKHLVCWLPLYIWVLNTENSLWCIRWILNTEYPKNLLCYWVRVFNSACGFETILLWHELRHSSGNLEIRNTAFIAWHLYVTVYMWLVTILSINVELADPDIWKIVTGCHITKQRSVTQWFVFTVFPCDISAKEQIIVLTCY